MGAAGGTAGVAPKRPVKVNRTAALRLTLLLAILLLLVGFAGIGAVQLLQRAMRLPTSDDIAQLVCTAYTTQNYDELLTIVDPTPAQPAQTGPFDDATRTALAKTLKDLDTGSGKVTSCTYQEPKFDNVPQTGSRLQYVLTMRRSNVTLDITMLITLVRQPDGSWKVWRGSDFTGIPGHPAG